MPQFTRSTNRAHQGFVLIELLVALGIIILIVSAAVVSIQRTRVASRDATRGADLATYSVALEEYKSVNTITRNQYPAFVGDSTYLSSLTALSPYLPATGAPKDPSPAAGCSSFACDYLIVRHNAANVSNIATSNTLTYLLLAGVEERIPGDIQDLQAGSTYGLSQISGRTPIALPGPFCGATSTTANTCTYP